MAVGLDGQLLAYVDHYVEQELFGELADASRASELIDRKLSDENNILNNNKKVIDLRANRSKPL